MRSSDIENACMVVRTPVARAAAAIGTRTRYRGSAARGRRRAFPRPLRLGEIFPFVIRGADCVGRRRANRGMRMRADEFCISVNCMCVV